MGQEYEYEQVLTDATTFRKDITADQADLLLWKIRLLEDHVEELTKEVVLLEGELATLSEKIPADPKAVESLKNAVKSPRDGGGGSSRG